ncbi:TetR/AcrR family transcriptional regulator [Amycolatopsis regifaucium]|uniref:TetR family transcriptional regulator n=1 Tax=Amycolatopsis regifaucium TaxID=546365 RepID=A0A154M9Z2_9PSEU|nr:TetR/AcrR family transcriptional regulator [Amycolatopsis regifaucium]KZB81431.1 TetR family transcriptional regulator [Amycolatopsis regifaucium]OKA04696.1 TetR family transcriptional regulator [Amycolatopsis regifaucium]SFH31571.1 DNA-binding transcriptional regulator, AcrR family [Amycolatopsis regifaucium]
MATSGTQRPGGRTERTRLAVLHATLDLLAERGFSELTVDAVAERSGVHKTTVYRRWSSPDGLVAAALRLGTEDDWAAPDTGSVEDDLYEVAAEVVRYFTEPGLKELPTASVLAAFQAPQAAEALYGFYQDRHERMKPIVERAIARGEVPEGTDPVEVVRAVCGPVFYRLFVSREGVTPAGARVTARAVAVAAREGAFRGIPHSED